MLNENIKNLRKSKGLSQEELAVKLNVVRQTVSKWENGLSVPDADMLIALSQVLDTPVSTLLGQTLAPAESDDLKPFPRNWKSLTCSWPGRKPPNGGSSGDC